MPATVMHARLDGDAIHDWPMIRAAVHRLGDEPGFELFVYRHAETTFNERGLVSGGTETDLTERGREAARQLSGYLPTDAGLVVCSGLRRAQETARLALQDYLGPYPDVVHDPRLNEVGLGILEGGPKRFIPQFADGDIDWAPPGGETYRQAARRAFSSVVDVGRMVAGADRRVLVFAHAGVMRILCTLAGGDWTPTRMYGLNFDDRMCVRLRSESFRLASFWCQDDRHA